jgi:hypothetical protein
VSEPTGEKKPTAAVMMACGSIRMGNRHRKEMGNLQSLADSIAALGLLHPIGITPDRELIFGERRLRAVRDILKQTQIAARVFDLDLDLSREAEHAENEERKALTLSERQALLRALEARRVEKRGGDVKKKQSGQLPTLAKSEKTKKNRHSTEAAKSRSTEATEAGFRSEREARRVGKIMEQGTPELIEAVDEGRISVSAGERLAQQPAAEQRRVLSLEEGKQKHEAKRLREQEKQERERKRKREAEPRLRTEDEIYFMIHGIQHIASTRISASLMAREYAKYKFDGTAEHIRLAILYLQEVSRYFEEEQHADVS